MRVRPFVQRLFYCPDVYIAVIPVLRDEFRNNRNRGIFLDTDEICATITKYNRYYYLPAGSSAIDSIVSAKLMLAYNA